MKRLRERGRWTCAHLLIMLAAIGAVYPTHGEGGEDETKIYLQSIKDFACDVAVYVDGLAGPLQDPVDQDYVRQKIVLAASDGQRLLNTGTSPLFTTPAEWLFWDPASLGGLNLTELADEACEKACDALDRYCAAIEPGGTPEDYGAAAQALWWLEQIYCHLFQAAGIS